MKRKRLSPYCYPQLSDYNTARVCAAGRHECTSKDEVFCTWKDEMTRTTRTAVRNSVSLISSEMSSRGVAELDLSRRRQIIDSVLPAKPNRHSDPIRTVSITKS